MKKITLKGIVMLMVLSLTVQTYSYAQGSTVQQNTARDGQTYRLKNKATGNYLSYDEDLGKYAPAAFNASDVFQVHRFMSNTIAVSGSTFYSIDQGGPDAGRGIMRIAGSGSNDEVFSTTKAWDATSGISDKVQNVWELGNDEILIQAKTANSYLTEQNQTFFDANGFWYQGTVASTPMADNQIWVLEAGTLSNTSFDTSSIFISNPVNNKLDIKGLTSNVNKVSIYSLLGNMVLSKSISGATNLSLDVTALATGMYVVELQGNEGSFTKKIVKQ